MVSVLAARHGLPAELAERERDGLGGPEPAVPGVVAFLGVVDRLPVYLDHAVVVCLDTDRQFRLLGSVRVFASTFLRVRSSDAGITLPFLS
jgi:hypothetical protein